LPTSTCKPCVFGTPVAGLLRDGAAGWLVLSGLCLESSYFH
jgi:hypothetical protein